jgi:hypothetical protein
MFQVDELADLLAVGRDGLEPLELLRYECGLRFTEPLARFLQPGLRQLSTYGRRVVVIRVILVLSCSF